MSENKTLLMIVEDDADNYKFTKEALKESCPNVEHLWVKDGEEALAYLADQNNLKPSIIFLDLNMPKIDGFECLKEIRASEKLKPVPVIILTNSNNPADAVRAYRAGANSFVSKPFSYTEFVKFFMAFRMYWLEFSQVPKIY